MLGREHAERWAFWIEVAVWALWGIIFVGLLGIAWIGSQTSIWR
jgi:hypothetical protein